MTKDYITLLYYILTSFVQGENMINPEIKLTDSILEVKAIGSIQDISEDLKSIQTKTIAELLEDEEKEQNKNNQEKE